MTRELQKTIGFVVVAVLLTGAAFLHVPDRTGKDAAFAELGQKFFPDFVDPNACTNLEVAEFNPDTAVVNQFQVMLKDGKWSIPSHFGYPADAKDRLVKTASGVIDLTKDTLRSNLLDDHKALGVLDPLDPKRTALEGVGKRVTLRDTSGRTLADFIIGNQVKDRPGMSYVRVPGQKLTYGVNVKVDLSTRFADWIETNLLKLDVSKVRKIAFDNHKIDADRGVPVAGEVVTIERKDASTPWNPVGLAPPEGKEIDNEKLLDLTSSLGDVKIVGVRPKPERLSRELVARADVKDVDPRWAQTLADKGFFMLRDGRFLSNEGDMIVSTDEGAVYTLRFGSVFTGSGSALTAGTEEAAPASKDAAAKDKKPAAVESRYLMVTIAFDPRLLPPLPDPDADKPVELPADVFHHEPGSPERVAQEKAATEKAEKKKAEADKRVADAEAKVKALSDRFARWYYLTPNETFKTLAFNGTNLFRDKSPRPPGGPGGMPPGFPGGGFPGGPPMGGRPMNPHGR